MSKITAVIFVVLALAFVTGCDNKFGITDITPRSGMLAGGESVQILGSGFEQNMGIAVYFGNQKSDNVVVKSSKELVVTTPSADKAVQVDVRILTDNGKQLVVKRGFRYVQEQGMDIRDLTKRQSQRQKPE